MRPPVERPATTSAAAHRWLARPPSGPTGRSARAGLPCTRRELLRLLGATSGFALLGATSGCGLRLERDAPPLPLLPSAHPYPAGAALRTELARSSAALAAAQAWSDAGGAALAGALVTAHRTHVEALRDRLAAVHEPVATPSTPQTTPSTPRASEADPGAGGVTVARRLLLAAERVGIDGAAAQGLAGVPATDRVLLGACLVTRAQAARLLGAPASKAPRSPRAVDAAQAAQLLTTVRPAVYGLQVVAARAVVSRSARAGVARGALAATLRHRQVLGPQAGAQAPADPLGYDLPEPLETPAQQDALARRLLLDLGDAYVRALAAVPQVATPTAGTGTTSPGPPDAAASALEVASLLGWAREAEWWRCSWGSQPRALPTT